jgi:solute carrier family 36 (proton-coupled amino acid transporter)
MRFSRGLHFGSRFALLLALTTMTSPSRPVNVVSPRPGSHYAEGISNSYTGTPIGTPDLRALRAQYATARTPPPNIPPRSTGTPTNLLRSVPSTDLSPNTRLGPSGSGAISALRPSTPSSGHDVSHLDLGDLPDEEKAKVLRRHLVSREERQAGPDWDVPDQEISRQSSMMFTPGSTIPAKQRQDTDPFPVPYDAPGADIT